MHTFRGLWTSLCERLGFDAVFSQSTYRILQACYGEGHRHYHTMRHIAECLLEAREANVNVDRDAVELAVWFHDIVYLPQSTSNERDSADLAVSILAGRMAAERLEAVRRLILATTHSGQVSDDAERLICDVDLASLAKPQSLFRADGAAIREEYAHVPDDVFFAGRLAFFRGLEGRSTLYHLAEFQSRCEAAARRNLRAAVEELERLD